MSPWNKLDRWCLIKFFYIFWFFCIQIHNQSLYSFTNKSSFPNQGPGFAMSRKLDEFNSVTFSMLGKSVNRFRSLMSRLLPPINVIAVLRSYHKQIFSLSDTFLCPKLSHKWNFFLILKGNMRFYLMIIIFCKDGNTSQIGWNLCLIISLC